MTAMTREPETPDTLLRDFLSLDIPEGYRAQLIDGEIVVTPPPGGNRERDVRSGFTIPAEVEIPSVAAAFCTDSTKISLTSATNTVTTRSVPTARLIGHLASSISP